MHYVLRKSFLVLTISISLASCLSPLDPDTPRVRTEDQPGGIIPTRPKRFRARDVNIVVATRGDFWFYAPVDTLVEIDTSTSPPTIWMHLDLRRAGQLPKLPFLESMEIAVDSFLANDRIRELRDDPPVSSWPFPNRASYVYAFDKDSSGRVRFFQTSNNKQNDAPTHLVFRHDHRQRKFFGSLQGEIIHQKKLILSYDAAIDIRY